MSAINSYFDKQLESLIKSEVGRTLIVFKGFGIEQIQQIITHPCSVLNDLSILQDGYLNLNALNSKWLDLAASIQTSNTPLVGFYEELLTIGQVLPRINIDKIIDINLKGTIYCNQILSKYFIKQKHGNIINISSIYGLYGGACESTYSAAKAGIIGLTKALALELAPLNIRVNAIAPGFIETNMTSCFDKQEKENIKKNTPLRRLGKPCDVANAALFLASDRAEFITGEVLSISGGALRF